MSEDAESSELEAAERSTANVMSEAEAREGYKWVQLGPRSIEIPVEWSVEKIPDLCEIDSHSFNSDEHNSDTFEYIDIESVSPGQIVQSKTTLVEEAPSRAKRRIAAGNTIVAKVRPYLRAFAPVTEEYDGYVCSTGFAVLSAYDEVCPEYITQTTLSKYFLDQMTNRMTGTSYPAVSASDFQNIEILTPPLHEQRRIAEILSTVDEQIQQTEERIEKTNEIKRGLRRNLLVRGVGHENYEQRQIGPLEHETPESWSVSKIPEMAKINPLAADFDQESHTFEYIDIESVEPGRIMESKTTLVEEAPSRAKRKIESGHILVSTVRPYLRAFAPVTNQYDGCICSSGFAVLEARDGYDSDYLMQTVLGNYFLKQMKIRQTGTSYPAVNKADFETIKLFEPPTEEQQRIGNILSELDKKRSEEHEQKQLLQELKRGLMQHLLTGTVRVPESIEVED